MVIKTLHEIGDYLCLNGEWLTIFAVHIYISDDKQTERYYLGNHNWLTIKRDVCSFK